MEIIDNIIQIMDRKGITAYKLEKDTGIKQQTFQGWKKGHQISVNALIEMIRYFEVTPNELFGYNTESDLTEKEKEVLELFKKLPDEEQKEYIIRMKEAARIYQKINQNNNQSNTQSRKDAI